MPSFLIIDEELPDYIMVMVANRRSHEQMEDDLQLFLGSNTEEFTGWLHQVLQKLQEVTVASLGESVPELWNVRILNYSYIVLRLMFHIIGEMKSLL
jgi:hypothetical protein